jgi:ATP dependent DNA ligase domain
LSTSPCISQKTLPYAQAKLFLCGWSKSPMKGSISSGRRKPKPFTFPAVQFRLSIFRTKPQILPYYGKRNWKQHIDWGDVPAILVILMFLKLQPMPLLKRSSPFDHADWLFELKYDGFRALAVIEHGRAQLLSRNGHPFASFSALAESISDSLPNARAIIDGEICCLDRRGRPQFKNLLFRRGNPCFFAFDLLTSDGKDLRTERLLDRKQELRRLLAKTSPPFPLRYTEHVEGSGTALFQRVCELDLEGIVAKQKFGPYVTEREHSTWFKILNRRYSQKQGREELFERERHSEPVPGWHSCVFACAGLEEAS